MLRSLLLTLSEREIFKHILLSHPWGRRLAQRFVAGENLEDAIRVVRQLNTDGMDATLDHLGENVRDTATADDACRAYLAALECIAAEKLRSHLSVKLTNLGLAFDEGLAQRLLRIICERAVRHGNFVRIDMEGSAFTEATFRIFRAANAPRHNLGVVIQSYLYRSEKDVAGLQAMDAWVRLVKGAYKEPPTVAFPQKGDVDENYRKLMKILLAGPGYHAMATHDTRLIAAAQEFARASGLGLDKYEFQMLYGVRRQLQRALVKKGYRVRIYIPYGRQWYQYFMRRLAERPANVIFLMRNLLRA